MRAEHLATAVKTQLLAVAADARADGRCSLHAIQLACLTNSAQSLLGGLILHSWIIVTQPVSRSNAQCVLPLQCTVTDSLLRPPDCVACRKAVPLLNSVHCSATAVHVVFSSSCPVAALHWFCCVSSHKHRSS
jgi:hypothetical protein